MVSTHLGVLGVQCLPTSDWEVTGRDDPSPSWQPHSEHLL